MPSMVDPYLKVSRAKEHLEFLQTKITEFDNSHPYTLSGHDDLQRGEYVVSFDFIDVPLEFGTYAGDFVCCLRSALDHLAWQLATATTTRPSKRVSFPIRSVNNADTQRHIAEATKGIPVDAVSVMESLQPYNCGNAYQISHLWRLEKLWNVDKHRHFTLHSAAVDIHFPALPKTVPASYSVLNDSGVMRFPLALKEQVQLNPWTKVDVRFGDDEEGILVTTSELLDMHQFVADSVIPKFSRFMK